MKKAILLVGMIAIMISCSKNQTCRDKTFGSNVWKCDDPGIKMMIFGADDTLNYVLSNNSQIYRSRYEFNDDCSGFVFTHNTTTLNMDITKMVDDTIYVYNNVTMNVHVYYRAH